MNFYRVGMSTKLPEESSQLMHSPVKKNTINYQAVNKAGKEISRICTYFVPHAITMTIKVFIKSYFVHKKAFASLSLLLGNAGVFKETRNTIDT